MGRNRKDNPFKAGQYYASKYEGNNGDLILGKVKSVRRSGEVILDNLLTGSRSTKSISVLGRRNSRVSKREADMIRAVYLMSGENRAAARSKAVEITRSVAEKEKTDGERKQRTGKNKKLMREISSLLKRLSEAIDKLEVVED